MAVIGSKSGATARSVAVIGQKLNNAHAVTGAKAGASLAGRQRMVSQPHSKGIGDLGGGKFAPGNTSNPVGAGQRDAATRPPDVKSMADPSRPSKMQRLEKKNKRGGV